MTITDAPTPEPGVMTELTAPAVSEVHHLSLTVTDLDASLDWYSTVFSTSALPVKFMHHECEDTGYGMLLPVPGSTVWIGLHTNTANQHERFDEAPTGLDHVSFRVAERTDLEAWTQWLDHLAIGHTGIRDLDDPFRYSTVVFRDPDNIQLEFIAVE